MASVQEASNGDGRRRPLPRRVLVFPLPFQGHISPMMQLGDVLHSRGLGVTVLHTRFNALDPALHPEFTFVSVPDGISKEVAATGNVISIILALNAAMEASGVVRDVLAAVLADEPAACLFIDANFLAVQKAAAALGLPTMVLRTGGAACFSCFLAYPMLHEKGYLPPKGTDPNSYCGFTIALFIVISVILSYLQK